MDDAPNQLIYLIADTLGHVKEAATGQAAPMNLWQHAAEAFAA